MLLCCHEGGVVGEEGEGVRPDLAATAAMTVAAAVAEAQRKMKPSTELPQRLGEDARNSHKLQEIWTLPTDQYA